MNRANHPQLTSFRLSQNWPQLVKTYNIDVTIEDFDHVRTGFRRIRTIPDTKIKSLTSYSIVYTDATGQILRLDRFSWQERTEAYFAYDHNRLAHIYQFGIIDHPVKKLLLSGELISMQTMNYDDNDRLIRIDIEDFQGKYYHHPGGFVRHISFNYKDKQAIRSTAWNDGVILDGKIDRGQVVVRYDHEEEQRLSELRAQNTTSKVAYTTRKKLIGIPIFPLRFGGYPPDTGQPVPTCTVCGQSMAFIAVVSVKPPLIQRGNLTAVPIYYCFICNMEGVFTQYHPTAFSPDPVCIVNYPIFTSDEPAFDHPATKASAAKAFAKIGGVPDWIQDEEWPVCPGCGKIMMFVAQISTDERRSNGRDVLAFGDSGKIYAFVCCNNVSTIVQYY